MRIRWDILSNEFVRNNMLRVCPKTMCYSVLPQFMATCSHLSRDSTMMNRPVWGALSSNKALLETAGSCRIKGLKESATSKSGHKGETMYQIITFMPKETYYPSSNSYTLMYVYIYISNILRTRTSRMDISFLPSKQLQRHMQ